VGTLRRIRHADVLRKSQVTRTPPLTPPPPSFQRCGGSCGCIHHGLFLAPSFQSALTSLVLSRLDYCIATVTGASCGGSKWWRMPLPDRLNFLSSRHVQLHHIASAVSFVGVSRRILFEHRAVIVYNARTSTVVPRWRFPAVSRPPYPCLPALSHVRRTRLSTCGNRAISPA